MSSQASKAQQLRLSLKAAPATHGTHRHRCSAGGRSAYPGARPQGLVSNEEMREYSEPLRGDEALFFNLVSNGSRKENSI